MASSVGGICAGVFVVETTPDTEVDVDVDPGRQVPQGAPRKVTQK